MTDDIRTVAGREQRGLVIAATCKIKQQGDVWIVPSQSEGQVHRVNVNRQNCTCADNQDTGAKCKHLWAVEFVKQRELFEKKPIDEESVTFTPKPTYKQNWPAYNAAQYVEKDRLQDLLFDLCREVEEPERRSAGRPAHSLRDAVFAMVYKVYSTFSCRRFVSDLRLAHERGYLEKEIPGIMCCRFMERAAFTPILKRLIVASSLPLRTVETNFAVDSSGFTTCRFHRWYDHKYGVYRNRHDWVKVHIACGVKTNIVTAVRIFDKDAPDCPQFTPLVQETAKNFTISEVSADKAYSSLENFETVAECGGTGYIAFRANATGKAGGKFEKMLHYFRYRQAEFMEHYHLRSNVESTFSMVKRKFGDSVRSKTDTAMVNETLCKFLCHNLCVLIREQAELGIEPDFPKKCRQERARPSLQLFGS